MGKRWWVRAWPGPGDPRAGDQVAVPRLGGSILCEVIGGLSFNISSWQKLVPKIICLLITELFFYWMLILINRGIFLILPVALLTLRRLAVFQ